jgi:hypothetical protein
MSAAPPFRSPLYRVPAKPNGIWTLIHPFIPGPLLMRIEAGDQRWGYAPGREAFCGADGDACALVARALCLAPTAAVGALIGKIGGSSAGISDGVVFVVGKSCVVRVDDGGPLYLTINDTFDGMSNNVGEMRILSVTFAPAPAKAEALPKAKEAPDPNAPQAASSAALPPKVLTPVVFGPTPPYGP